MNEQCVYHHEPSRSHRLAPLFGWRIADDSDWRSRSLRKCIEPAFSPLGEATAGNAKHRFQAGFPRSNVAYTQAVLMHLQTGDGHLVTPDNPFPAARRQVVRMKNVTLPDYHGTIM